ncbi:hypothetical protein GGF38_004241, partial [Coemansia sp. RSA 25]
IDVELGCIYSGMASELLSRVPYRDCIFPAVRAITFTFSIRPDDTGNDIDASVVQANITAFVQRLLQLVPRVRECDFDDHFDYKELFELDLGQFSSLARQILANVDRLKFDLGDEYVHVDLDYTGMCNLVHIDYSFGVHDCSCFQLVRQCAPMLQSLKLCSRPYLYSSGLDPSNLIRDTDGSYVAYSCLQSLSVDIWNDSDMPQQRPSFGSFVAFPALRHVDIRSEYPFSDDTLFRGAAFTVLDVVALIKSLPLLSDLRLDVPKLDSHLADIPKCRLFKTLIESHAPMGKQLRRLIVQNYRVPLEDLAVFTMLLVSLCPNLDFMDVSHKLIAYFDRHMKG